jgi:hypothetical protein
VLNILLNNLEIITIGVTILPFFKSHLMFRK